MRLWFKRERERKHIPQEINLLIYRPKSNYRVTYREVGQSGVSVCLINISLNLYHRGKAILLLKYEKGW